MSYREVRGSRFSDVGGGDTHSGLPTTENSILGFRLVHDDSYLVSRGGSWFYAAGLARAADRLGYGPGYRFGFLGFRLVVDWRGV